MQRRENYLYVGMDLHKDTQRKRGDGSAASALLYF